MKNARTIEDAVDLHKDDIFDLEAAYLDSVRARRRDARQGVFHPSAVGMCGVRNVLEFISAPALPTIAPEDQEIFDMGHAVHDLVQSKLEALKPTLEPRGISYEFRREVTFDPRVDQLYVDYGIGGTCDGLLTFWTTEWTQRGIVEIKSIKDKNYKRLTGPKEDHVLQAHIYAYRFDCPVMWLWYYNKDTSERRVFPLVFDLDVLMGALNRYAGWLKHADQGTLPPREESWWACPRCEYREECQPPSLQRKAGPGRKSKPSPAASRTRLHRIGRKS
jgi:CRISPR/Cas system-associated exonuclease Cas4 (RecB family)